MQMNRSSWSVVDFGQHGPPPPVANRPVLHLPLRASKPVNWKPTSCYVWSRDGGESISMNTFKKLRAQKKAAVIDKDFTLSDDEITVIRDLHKRIVRGI
ncbi:hypothetical protein FOMPIDRAFT_92115 [Fomitopsis schrenkii]|uniref:Uncharacterized protein n=1 Tax=Fomitopsis schrenkii TaxID=2126942 RepID=S8DNA9_FOMSC|nr:hypothetical protein FOMPIDRAFT_92115 [Fomitopsis schrenkii]